ncbi:hypothetical protein FJZ21_03805 [Candidatus Pacearchaeota archaeon]|nr:hypothetical protein [Candidatus Pacearchaeota archaeon]
MNQDKLIVKPVIRGPVYSEGQVPTSYCARYARMAAKDLFDLEYPVGHAWKMRSFPGIETIPIHSTQELADFANMGMLKPGMLVGFRYFFTHPDNLNAARKEGVDYTHMALLIDTDSEGGPFFADKFKSDTRPRISLATITRLRTLKPRELLYLKGNPFFDNV